MPRIMALIAAAALLSAPAFAKPRKNTKVPFTIYPGAQYSKKASLRYQDERGADAAWAFAVKSKFKKVSAFYKKQVSSRATAETESKSLYFAITARSEVRVEKAKHGWVLIYMARKSLPRVTEGEQGLGAENGSGIRTESGPAGDGYGSSGGSNMYPPSGPNPGRVGPNSGPAGGPNPGPQNYGPPPGSTVGQPSPAMGMDGGAGNASQGGPGMAPASPYAGPPGGSSMGPQGGAGMAPQGPGGPSNSRGPN